MLDVIPAIADISRLLGSEAYEAWRAITDFVNENYDMDTLWNKGGKGGVYECKFRKSSKTLCCTYLREKSFVFLVVFGKAEREKFEADRHLFSKDIQNIYEETHQYHDGKWIMIDVTDSRFLNDAKRLISIKKKPKKPTVY